MPSKLEKCCNFIYSIRNIELDRLTLSILLTPAALSLIIFVVLFLLSTPLPGAVVSNSLICSSIGKDVLIKGGSAVDAAIATLFCEGVAMPNGAGLGGGFTAIIFTGGKFDSIIATPTVPAAMTDDTYFNTDIMNSALVGGIPGELKGYWEMYKKYGTLPWKDLVEPTIRLCEDGIPMTQWFASVLRHYSGRIQQSPTMDSIFTYDPNVQSGDGEYKIKFLKLANTLKIIAHEGASVFYNGSLGDDFINDLQMDNSKMTKKDLEDYKVVWDSNPPAVHIKDVFKIVTTPFPTSGPIVIFVLNIIKNLSSENYALFWHKYIEAIKHGFGQYFNLCEIDKLHHRNSTKFLEQYHEMISTDFAQKIRDLIHDKRVFTNTKYYGSKSTYLYGNGSANVCVSSPRGGVVVASSSLLTNFGAMYVSPSTGIILNNLLGKFIYDGNKTTNNHIIHRPKPGEHIYSVFSPTIVIRQRISQAFFMISATGGPKATTSILLALIKYILLGSSAAEAVDTKYLHNQLFPNIVEYEDDFGFAVTNFLQKIGHKFFHKDEAYENFTAIATIGHRHVTPDAQFNRHVGGNRAMVNAKSDLNILLIILIGTLFITVIGLMLYEVLNPTEYILPLENNNLQTEV